MSAWKVAPCLLVLRDEFNALSPGRDKGADGTIGDAAHQAQGSSDHLPDANNWVKALDIDSSGPWPGTTFHILVMFIVNRCRSGAEKRIRYIIHDHVIYHERDGFKGNPYTGADPHTNHAHFSCNYDQSIFTRTGQWLLAASFGDDMPLSQDDIDKVSAAVWAKQLPSPYVTEKDGSQALKSAGDYQRYTPSASWHQTTQAMITNLSTTLNGFIAADSTDDAKKATALAAIQDAVTALVPSIVSGVLAALPKDDGAPVTQEQVTTAVTEALRKAFSGLPVVTG